MKGKKRNDLLGKGAAILVALSMAFVMAACGGGGSDSAAPPADGDGGDDYGFPGPGETAVVAVTGANLSNGMWNLWNVTNCYDPYFEEISDEMEEIHSIHLLFSDTKRYVIFQFEDGGSYYTVPDDTRDYTYAAATGEFTFGNAYNAVFNQDSGYMGYFDALDSFQYSFLNIEKAASFNGTVISTTENAIDLMFIRKELDEVALGDGASAGKIDVTVNYSGSKTVGADNPVLVYVVDSSYEFLAGGAVWGKSGTLTVKGIPDGTYRVFAAVKPQLVGELELEHGDSHLWYGGTYFTGPGGLSGTPTAVTISGGSTGSVAISFDDTHVYSLAERRTELTGVAASYNSGTKNLTVTVNIDTSDLGSGITGNQNMWILMLSPSGYMVQGIKAGEHSWQRGQLFGFNLTYQSGTTWSGTTSVPDYRESGEWLVHGIQMNDNNSGTITSVQFENQQRGNITNTYMYTEDYKYNDWQVESKNKVAAAYVTMSTSSQDVTGPSLIGLSVDYDMIGFGDTATITVSMSDTGGSGPETTNGAFVGSLVLEQGDLDEKEYDIVNNAGTYQAVVPGSGLDLGTWSVRYVRIQDKAGNQSNFLLYDDLGWSGNPFGIDATHFYLNNFNAELPVQAGATKKSITRN